jgi:hypothetical protein
LTFRSAITACARLGSFQKSASFIRAVSSSRSRALAG